MPMKNIIIPEIALGWVRYAAPSLYADGDNKNRLVPISKPLMTLNVMPINIIDIGIRLLPFISSGKINDRWK